MNGIFPDYVGPTVQDRHVSLFPDWVGNFTFIIEPINPGGGGGANPAEEGYRLRIMREDEEIMVIIMAYTIH
jgi:hypothetical protein